MTPPDVRLQVGIGRKRLAAHVALSDHLKAGCRPAAAAAAADGGFGAQLRLEKANVLRLIAQLALRLAKGAFERDVASMQRLLNVEQVLGNKLQQSEELHEVGLAEPVQVCIATKG